MYIDFNENRHKIKRKSVYHRKYHIGNRLNQINEKHDTEISYKKKQKINLNYLIKCYHKLMKAQKE